MSGSPATAYKQGLQAAYYAAGSVAKLGISRSVPVIYDLEPYAPGCTASVQSFASGWTIGLHNAGRLAGIYGSESSAMTDLSAAEGTAGYHEPDDVWVVTNNGQATTDAFSEPSGSAWQGHRMNQFNLDIDRTYGGVTMDIDESDGNNAVLRSAPPVPADVAPAISLSLHARRAASTKARYTWRAKGRWAPIQFYDVRLRTHRPGHHTSPWHTPAALKHTSKRSLTVALTRGEKICVELQAKDDAGNLTRFSSAKCTTRT